MKYSLAFVLLVVAAVDVSALPANMTVPTSTSTSTPTSKVNEFHLPKDHEATVPQGRPLEQQLAWQFDFDDCNAAECMNCTTSAYKDTCQAACSDWAMLEGLPTQGPMPETPHCQPSEQHRINLGQS